MFRHDDTESLGVLLVNLGTPDSPSRSDVRRYLKEFLWDHRVVEVPRLAWWLVLNLVILNTRPQRSAAAYEKVWTPEGSPLLVVSRKQARAVQAKAESDSDSPVHVALAMRYGNPSIKQGLSELREAGARRILVLPLYPQYSATTTASTFDAVTTELQQWRWLPELRFINHYHDAPAYISVLADSIRRFQSDHGTPDKLVISFHGIPEAYLLAGDPYYCECHKTARLLAAELQLGDDQWVMTFQSRLGPKKWLQPYTDKTLKKMAGEDVRSVQVVCPGFSADCLETLEEIAVENRDYFLGAGGERFDYIPCLNDDPAHIDMLWDLIARHTRDWGDATSGDLDPEKRRALAMSAGAES